jgi:hypothetical protein
MNDLQLYNSRLSEICIKLHIYISYVVAPHVYCDNRGYGAGGPSDVGEENNIHTVSGL